MPPEDIPKTQMSMNQMASMFSGIQQTPEQLAASAPPPEEQETLDVFQYWGEEKRDVKTELDPEAVEKLKR